MRAFHYRPLAAGAAYLRRVAKRLASKVGDNGGVKHEVHDGYLLRAVGSRRSVTVTALDPEAVWLFLHHQTPPSGNLQRLLGVRRFDRAAVAGTGPDDPTIPTLDNPRVRWSAGAGYYGSVDLDALGLLTNVPALAGVRPDRISTLTLGNTDDYTIGAATFATRFQLYGVSFDPARARIIVPGQDMSGEVVEYADLTDWLLRESGLASLLGDSDARLQVRHQSRYQYRLPTFAAQSARDARVGDPAWYADVAVGGGFVSQPEGPDTPPTPEDPDAARLGIAGVFVARLIRPGTPPGLQYPLTKRWAHRLLLTDNPEVELVPTLVAPEGYDRYHAHGVTGAGLAVDPVVGGRTLLVAGLYCTQGDPLSPTVWVSLQAHQVLLDGTRTPFTLRKTTADTQWHIGHDVTLFGQHGVAVVEASIVDDKIDQSSLSLWHVGMDGVMRETGLKAAGWQPFTDYILNPTGKTAGAVFGQAPRPWCALGDDKVAVLARNYTVAPDATTVTWTLVLLDQLTGAFVEARGVVATDAALTSGRAFLSVIVPETRKADDSVVPAILLCALGTKTRISRDGGLTWTLLFEDYVGLPVYLGNRLHPVALETNL